MDNTPNYFCFILFPQEHLVHSKKIRYYKSSSCSGFSFHLEKTEQSHGMFLLHLFELNFTHIIFFACRIFSSKFVRLCLKKFFVAIVTP